MDNHQYQLAGQGHNTKKPASTGRWWTKLSLRLLSMLCCIATIGAAVYYMTKWTIGALLMMGPPAAVAFLWDCVDAIALCVRGSQYGVHPMACLIVDFILFISLGAMSGVIAHTAVNLSDSGYYFAFFEDGIGNAYLHIVLGFGIMATIVHLGIFILAIYDVKGRRAVTPRVVYVHTDSNGVPLTNLDQQSRMPPSNDPPPAYSVPPDQGSSYQYADRIYAARPAGVAELSSEKKV